ncbi:MAG TPA: Crp/Fnr family transcriptional regulator [Pyrinomonadaceae bacterium]
MENLLLNRLPNDEHRLLEPHLQRVHLHRGEPVISPDKPIDYIFFPITALLSLITVLSDGSMIESGTIGREGMSGIPVLLDATQTTMETVTQVPGEAFKIKARELKAAYQKGGKLQKLLNRYMHTVMVLSSQSAACNARHELRQRFSRWILMSSDGVGSDEVSLTQEYLSVMLGVRRAGVTVAAGALQAAGAIEYERGSIKIRNREILECASCECYQRTKEEYQRLFND